MDYGEIWQECFATGGYTNFELLNFLEPLITTWNRTNLWKGSDISTTYCRLLKLRMTVNLQNYTGLFLSPLNMLKNWLMPQLNEDSNDYIFQQDGSPAHYKEVRGYLNRNLAQRCIGRTGKEDGALMRWPPRSPDLTPCEFFFWGFVKDTVFAPPLPANLQIFATVSPLLWLWSTVICWHACGTRWTIA